MHKGKHLADFYPVVAKFSVRLQQHSVFLLRPTLLLDIRVKLVVPPFPALLARTWRVCTHVKLVWLRRIWRVVQTFRKVQEVGRRSRGTHGRGDWRQ